MKSNTDWIHDLGFFIQLTLFFLLRCLYFFKKLQKELIMRNPPHVGLLGARARVQVELSYNILQSPTISVGLGVGFRV